MRSLLPCSSSCKKGAICTFLIAQQSGLVADFLVWFGLFVCLLTVQNHHLLNFGYQYIQQMPVKLYVEQTL